MWYKLFQDGREDANDTPRYRRSSTSATDETVKKIVFETVESLLEKMLWILTYRLACAIISFQTFWE
uniref:Uncharacterized protein n=1 Tax=Lepeophtheirus salmonis TaxID=72036 RepID=A0A0K2TDL3_LEPSM